jgi:hypothetical protein
MTSEKNLRWGGLFACNWAAFNAGAGVKYAVGIVIVFSLGHVIEFPTLVAGISALLAWLTDVPGRRRDRVLGMVVFAIGAPILTVLSAWVGTEALPQIVAISIVTFAGTLFMIKGQRAFMVSWSLIYWFLLAPLFHDPSASVSITIYSLLLGAGIVILLTLLPALVRRGDRHVQPEAADGAANESPAIAFVIGYALAVTVTMAVGLTIGILWIESDPTLVANAAFMVIGLSSRQTWILGLERAIGATLGIVVGFLIFTTVESELLIYILGVALSFLCMSLMNVNSAFFIFFFLIFISDSWFSQGIEQANTIANERIVAELIGVVMAGIAIAVLQRWSTRRQEHHHVKAQQSGI